ncbi:MAG: hypothetical protein PWQ54_1855 [Bacteroidales bacterium]|jgi:hypothetical protein|nr:hypothetical protein [Bacteroidales bacterium]
MIGKIHIGMKNQINTSQVLILLIHNYLSVSQFFIKFQEHLYNTLIFNI